MPDGSPTITDCAHVTVTTGRVSVALTRAELDLVLAGNALRFTAPDGTSEVHLVRTGATPTDPAPRIRLNVVEGAFAGVGMGGTVTPLFSDVPFILQLSLHADEPRTQAGPVRIGNIVVQPPIDDRGTPVGSAAEGRRGSIDLREPPIGAAAPRIEKLVIRPAVERSTEPVDPGKESPRAAAGATLMGGGLMIGIGALRAGLSVHHDSTNTLMMVIGAGMAVYGAFRWITNR